MRTHSIIRGLVFGAMVAVHMVLILILQSHPGLIDKVGDKYMLLIVMLPLLIAAASIDKWKNYDPEDEYEPNDPRE